MDTFDHEKLEVYQLALRFLVLADKIIQSLPQDEDMSRTSYNAHRHRRS